MQFSTVLSAIAFAASAQAWAKSGNGEWIANNELYGIMPYSGGAIKVYEACTYHGSNALVPAGHGCRYWINGQGHIFSGTCRDTPGHVITTRNCQ
ncbi:hypothetical protein LB507_008960 [Fusarium sp. FIESC RH6]|nr:hypothetical protein LB507_008960 [Fusarium sp. FIESC RH6]